MNGEHIYLLYCLFPSVLAFVYFVGITAWDYYDYHRSKQKRKPQ